MHKVQQYKLNIILCCSIPWFLALLFTHHPVLSFFIAYLGSFFIFYLTIWSPLKCIQSTDEVMKPMIIIHLIFAGFMCCTSVFFFADHLGYTYFKKQSIIPFMINEQTYLLAKCQRLALLGHIGLVAGMIINIKPTPEYKYQLRIQIDPFLIKWSLIATMAAFALSYMPMFVQFKYYLLTLATTTQALLLMRGIVYKKPFIALFGGVLFGFHLLGATLTGFKEIIIVSFITITFIAYPYYKRTVILFILPGMYLLLYSLPTLTTIIRTESWNGNKSKEAARIEAYETLTGGSNQDQILHNNWEFLTNRLSEISMFSQYVKYTPAHQPYYGTAIINNAMLALIPRSLWRQKPNTEKVAMERVYKSRVVNRLSTVSAKTRPVFDGYLSVGPIGVLLSMIVYGMLTQWLCNKSEALFGGYELGCVVVFNSLFQQLWRGNNWEFLINNLVYGFILMLIMFYTLKFMNLLKAVTL
ncbi:exosortase Y-associated Wzy-like protein [Pedobacter sp.]|uniref:exosortase Y-associated Wzy-like protein n=1 Tax=Pedobacter sp. TaxID=1411316 RepID=UPI003D7FDC50